jgi:hypothetical protein
MNLIPLGLAALHGQPPTYQRSQSDVILLPNLRVAPSVVRPTSSEFLTLLTSTFGNFPAVIPEAAIVTTLWSSLLASSS